jgi:AcrR family transcriptional regulator
MDATSAAEKPAPIRERILCAARAMLEEEGFAALSTRSVAARAGCSIGTIYNHFRDFDDVVLHLNAETVGWLSAALDVATDQPAASRPAALVDAYFDFLEAHELSWSALFQHYLPVGYELPEWYREVIASTVRKVIEALQDLAADVSPAEREGLVVALWSGLHGLASLDRQSKLSTVTPGASARGLSHILVRSALRGAGWNGK